MGSPDVGKGLVVKQMSESMGLTLTDVRTVLLEPVDLRGGIRLPFRDSGEYPELAEAFTELHSRYERIVKETFRWAPFK